MERSTDMEKLHELMEQYLNMEVEVTSDGDVRHPYLFLLWHANDVLFGKSDSEVPSKLAKNERDMYSFVFDQTKMEKIRAEVKKKLFETPVKDIKLVCNNFFFPFLKKAKEFLSSDDLSTIIGSWLRDADCEPTECDISKEDICELLKACNRQVLMDKDEYDYYQKCISGSKVNVFRGSANDWGELDPAECFFWNVYPGDIAKYDDCFWGGHIGYRATIDASDIFVAYSNTGGLVVVNPDKLQDIEDYNGFDDFYEEDKAEDEDEGE